MNQNGRDQAHSAQHVQDWLYPAVEALTAITTSAAPLENKLQSVSSTVIEEAGACAIWVIDTTSAPPSVRSVASDDQEIDGVVSDLNGPVHQEIVGRLLTMTYRTHLSHSPLINRNFLVNGTPYIAVCSPLVTHGKQIGSFVCVFDEKSSRTDVELNQLRVCARVLAMAIGSSAEFGRQQLDSQWARRFEALTTVLPGASMVLSPKGEIQVSNSGHDPVPGVESVVLEVAHDQSHERRIQRQEYTHRQREAFRAAMDGRPAKCHVNHQAAGGMRVVEHRFVPVPDSRGVTTEVALFARDVTDVIRMQQSLRELAERDAVTGAMTMGALIQRARTHMVSAAGNDSQTVIFSIELDGSGTGVHLLGNDAFEELLQTINTRIHRTLTGVDTIARRGERNFVAMVDASDGRKYAAETAIKIINELREPIVTLNKEHSLSITVGYAIYPEDGTTADEIFRYADIAASNAQRSGRNCWLQFRPEMAQDADDRSKLEARLYKAVENEEFTLAFQPKVNIGSGAVAGVEALLRWKGKNGVSPARFIPVAEECGLISYIGEWALKQACLTAKRWEVQGIKIPISVNVSTRQFHDSEFHSTVRNILSESQCDPAMIDLEVTEGVMFTDPSAAILSFTILKEMGLSISIDDFGTGYSSLSYLKNLPADCVKIDRTFIHDLPNDADNAAIAKAIIAMAKAMNMRVVAEGVEERECLSYLLELGCDEVQGYYFSQPLYEADFLNWYRAYRQLAA